MILAICDFIRHSPFLGVAIAIIIIPIGLILKRLDK